jgi:hypothetical protein
VDRKHPKGENQPEAIFDCVPRLLGERKWFDVSLVTMLRDIDDGKRIDLQSVHHTQDENTSEELRLPLRLRVSGRPRFAEGWHITLLLYNKPIDGFGYEERFCDIDGIQRSGWHRHIWNHVSQDARGKILVRIFERGNMTFRDFIIRALKEMKISYPTDDDYATPTLF